MITRHFGPAGAGMAPFSSSIPRAMALLMLALATGGCSTSPELKPQAVDAARLQPLTIVGPRGRLHDETARQTLKRALGGSAPLERVAAHLRHEQSVARNDLTSGNAVTLLVDGPAAYAVMFDAIDGATEHIHLETYILGDDELGQRLAGKLLARRRLGVEVRVIYDVVGSFGMSDEFLDRLREGGVLVKPFSVDPFTRDFNVRDHRKLLVVDGRTVFTGGINVSDSYSSSSFSSRGVPDEASPSQQRNWRDTHLRIDGPAVPVFQGMFLRTWKLLPGNEPAPHSPYPPIDAPGADLVRPVGSTGGDGEHRIYSAYLSALRSAHERIWLTHAYFSPDPQLLGALKDAARRGVDVRIMLPHRSDSNLVLYASQSHFDELMQAGVRLYRRRGAVLHAKTALVDGYWTVIGSANLDYRSFLHNHEAVAIVVSHTLAQDMAHLFERDLEHAEPLDPEIWKRRGIWQRVMETLASSFDYWL